MSAKIITLVPVESFCIQGEADEEAVFITKSETFRVRMAETSNTLLLFENVGDASTSPRTYTGLAKFGGYLELQKTNPRLSKVVARLRANVYRGSTLDLEPTDLPSLLLCSQASVKELLAELSHIHAYPIDGHYRLISMSLQDTILSIVLSTLAAHGLDWFAFSLPEALAALNSSDDSAADDALSSATSQDLFSAVLRTHAISIPSSDSHRESHAGGGTTLYSLSVTSVARMHATLLVEKTGVWDAEEFMSAWQQRMPQEGDEWEVQESMLGGIAVRLLSGGKERIVCLLEQELATDPSSRLEELLVVKEQWTKEGIAPYVAAFVEPSESLDKWLGRHLRIVNPLDPAEKPRLYGRRFPSKKSG